VEEDVLKRKAPVETGAFRFVRALALAGGLVDVKVCAEDGTLSGLRPVYRLADRGNR
jgi:hypothetical protein